MARRNAQQINYPALKPSVVDYSTLRAQKARLGLNYVQLETATGMSPCTLSAALNGGEKLKLQSLIALAKVLRLRVFVTFVPEDEIASSADGERAAEETQGKQQRASS